MHMYNINNNSHAYMYNNIYHITRVVQCNNNNNNDHNNEEPSAP